MIATGRRRGRFLALIWLVAACGQPAASSPAGTPSGTGGPNGLPSGSPAASLQADGRTVAAALHDPARAADGARSLVDALGMTSYLGTAGVAGLAQMAQDDATAMADGATSATLSDLHAALAPLLPNLGEDQLLGAYATAYGAAPTSFMAQLLADTPLKPDTPVSRLVLWALFVDGFVNPDAAAAHLRIASLALPAAPLVPAHTAGLSLPPIPSPDPRLDSFEFSLLLSQIPAIAYAIPFDLHPTTVSGHEGHGGPGPTLELVAQFVPGYPSPVSPTTGLPLLLPASAGMAGLPVTWDSSGKGLLAAHGSMLTPLGAAQPTDVSGASTFRYQLRREPGNQTGPVESNGAPVTARVPLRALLQAAFTVSPAALAFAFGDRVLIGSVTIEWHQSSWFINQPFRTPYASGHIVGLKCDGPAGTWTAKGVYDASGDHGNQAWTIDITMQTDASGDGTYKYTDLATMPVGPVTVTLKGKAGGTVTLGIDPTTALVTMNLQETYHTYKATVPGGGFGNDQNAPLQSSVMEWQPGDPDQQCSPPTP